MADDATGPISGFGAEGKETENGSALTKSPPPNYLVLRAGSLTPERLPAQSEEEARATVQRQVRSSATKVVYLYRLVGAEVYVPSSDFVEPQDIKERLFKE